METFIRAEAGDGRRVAGYNPNERVQECPDGTGRSSGDSGSLTAANGFDLHGCPRALLPGYDLLQPDSCGGRRCVSAADIRAVSAAYEGKLQIIVDPNPLT